jgi:hypothetical protein
VTIDGGGKTIPLKGGTGSVITVGNGVTLTLRNITFKGKDDNTAPLIKVTTGGTLVLENGAVITGNTNNSGSGGGVSVSGSGAALVMNGGVISGNTASYGGGGDVVSGGSFTMNGGKISGNSAADGGGGVNVYKGTFTMNNGVISGNTASGTEDYYGGGGVYVSGTGGTFTMEGGVIYGYTAGDALSNWVGTRNPDGTPNASYTAGKGDVVYYAITGYPPSSKYRDAPLGEEDTFNSDTDNGWNL